MLLKNRHIILFLAVLLLFGSIGRGQTGFYIPQKGKIFFYGDTATIFSNVINQGQLGTGKNAVVNFKAKQWENDPLSLITDESNGGNGLTGQGGLIRFMAADTSMPGLYTQQMLIGGYNAATRTGPMFSNLSVENHYGVELLEASTKIRRRLNFTDGHLYADQNILVVGDGDPGTISGYDENHFVVTGTSVTGGFLLREKISQANAWVSFPVGSSDSTYAPAALQSHSGVPDDFYARVFDSVKAGVASGQDLAARSVNKTWQIGKLLSPNLDMVDIMLQHSVADEGPLFQSNRQNAYVSQFSNGSWDIGYPQTTPQAGSLTSGSPITGQATNSRTFSNTIGTTAYFTKFTGKGDTSLFKTKLYFSAYRTDYLHVWTFWTTNPEIGVKYFVVQRRLSNESVFSNRDTVASKAVNGASFNWLNYGYTDPNNYGGVSFYRLLSVQYNGDTSYSNIVPVGPDPGGFGVVIWPNPNDGHFFVGISSLAAVKSIFIYNDIGQLIHREEVNNRGQIAMYLRTPGAYMVAFISFDGKVLTTKKLIVGGH